MNALTPMQAASLAHALDSRDLELREEIRATLVTSGDAKYIDLAGSVHDIGDEAVANELIELGDALIERHVRELREIDAARRRLSEGAINRCAGCGREIGLERLLSNPVAVRCVDCQAQWEKTYAHEATPRL